MNQRIPVGLLGLLSLSLAAQALEIPVQRTSTPSRTTPSSSPATLYEEDSSSISWSGPWSTNPLKANSGGRARLAMDAGAQASFQFTGEGVSWIGYRDEWSGNARVLLDGVFQTTVDTYSTPASAQATLFTVNHLDGGTHTLTIETTGTHNPASAGSWVWVDAFAVNRAAALVPSPSRTRSENEDVLDGRRDSYGPASGRTRRNDGRGENRDTPNRFDDDDPAITWSGAWSTNHLKVHRDGSARLSMEPQAKATFTFRGTGATWIGYRDEWSGIADVFVDGRLRSTVDTYATPAQPQVVLYAIDGLRDGPHTLTIQPTGRRRPASQGSWIWVDGFSITR